MNGYNGDSISEIEWDEADMQHITDSEEEDVENCYEGSSDLFTED